MSVWKDTKLLCTSEGYTNVEFMQIKSDYPWFKIPFEFLLVCVMKLSLKIKDLIQLYANLSS